MMLSAIKRSACQSKLRKKQLLLRPYSTAEEPQSQLKAVFAATIPEKTELLKQVRSKADTKIGSLTIGHVLGGMRGLKCLTWEGSVLDANEGIRFHGRTIADCSVELPKSADGRGKEMLPEAMFWLLLTGKPPTQEQIRLFSAELASKSVVPQHVVDMFHHLPRQMHPMTRLSLGVAALNTESQFAKAYAEGMRKAKYWEPMFDDCIALLAKIPRIAAMVFRPDEIEEVATQPLDPSADWAYNFATLLGKGGPENSGFQDLLRLYLALHGDHEGGNVSAHTSHLVGSSLSDAYLSYAAGLLGLAGPLHGLAAQEVLRWILEMKTQIEHPFTHDAIGSYLWSTLKSGQVIPGYGHGVLRSPDPRFQTLMSFGASRPDILADPIYQLVEKTSVVAPEVLKKHGKTQNPYPNVDAVSGALFYHYGFRRPEYYTVAFGVSRALGPLSQLIWSRALGLPIERPKSVDLTGLLKTARDNESS